MAARKAARAPKAPSEMTGSGEVERLLAKLPAAQRPLVDAVRAVIARAVPAAQERVKWNAPSFALAEHFATFHLRAKVGVQLVLHLGAKPRTDIDLREVPGLRSDLLEWKGSDRATVSLPDLDALEAARAELTRILRTWSRHVR